MQSVSWFNHEMSIGAAFCCIPGEAIDVDKMLMLSSASRGARENEQLPHMRPEVLID